MTYYNRGAHEKYKTSSSTTHFNSKFCMRSEQNKCLKTKNMTFLGVAILCTWALVAGASSPPGPPATAPGNAGVCSNEGGEFSNLNFWFRCERNPGTDELTAKVRRILLISQDEEKDS